MKKGEKRLLIFELVLLVILLLNSFVLGIFTGIKLSLLLLAVFLLFKAIFGFEKSEYRVTKIAILDTIIFVLVFLIAYYLFGLIVGFAKLGNYYTWGGLRDYIIPVIVLAILREILRYNFLLKANNNKLLIYSSVFVFVLFDLTATLYYGNYSNAMYIFKFIALSMLPAISFNIYATYVTRKAGYKSIVLYALVIGLYPYIIPIVPDAGEYLTSLVNILIPLLLMYRLSSTIKNETDVEISRDYNKKDYAFLAVGSLIVGVLVYFSSGYFAYHAVAIATGSMSPNINRGDIAVIKKKNIGEIEVGDVIAYDYHDVIVVHRVSKKLKVDDGFYYYSKGDANKEEDNYIIKRDMIEGKVKFRIPYLGIPTVWLNELWED